MAENKNALAIEQLRRVQDPAVFNFASTSELPGLEEIIGQERAIRAVSFGISIESPGYHMYALGTSGTGKIKMIRKFLDRKAAEQPVPDDWCYVNNFENPDQPIALRMPPGQGCTFRDAVDTMVEELETEVPQAFEGEEYDREQERIQEELQKRQQEIVTNLRTKAEARSFSLVQTPQGILLAPMINGEVANPEAFSQLDPETRQKFEQAQAELQEEFRESMREVQGLQQEVREKLRELDRQVIGFIVNQKIESLKANYANQKNVLHFLDEVRDNILENVQQHKRAKQTEETQQQIPMLMGQRQQGPSFEQYRVNVIVDNSKMQGAPVVLERNPTYHNLVGRTEQQAQFGALVTNFRMIKGGALHRANNGYLIVEVRDLLTKPLAWDALKRALRNKEIKIESMYEALGALATRSLEPEPIPLNVKVVLVGDPFIYYLLYRMDEEFRELFKVKADFADQMDWENETVQQYARFIGNICREEKLLHFDASGVARVIEESSRMVSHQKKLAARFGDIVDLVRQASFWAGENGHELVQASDVKQAIDEKIYRANQLEERLREMIDEETILIDTQGEVEGQVNGISVLPMGDHSFGKPSRITARTYVGSAGVVNIERETELGGRIHNKGMLILNGYLGGKYAQDLPLALSASITFEQLYEEVEGDSASSAELYALLSSLSGFPIRQDLAVTGSVNQRGQVQAIGGVNEKVEGFFDVCRLTELTGSQGVIIPESNIKHLMLREDVVQAVADGKFHIYAVKSIDEGIELLTGKPAGERSSTDGRSHSGRYPEGSVNRAVQDRLRELAERVQIFSNKEKPNKDGHTEIKRKPIPASGEDEGKAGK
jgi:lon-related putative ATP-dependent protease